MRISRGFPHFVKADVTSAKTPPAFTIHGPERNGITTTTNMDTFAQITGSAMETRVETPPPPKVHIVMRTMWICNGSKRQNDANLLH